MPSYRKQPKDAAWNQTVPLKTFLSQGPKVEPEGDKKNTFYWNPNRRGQYIPVPQALQQLLEVGKPFVLDFLVKWPKDDGEVHPIMVAFRPNDLFFWVVGMAMWRCGKRDDSTVHLLKRNGVVGKMPEKNPPTRDLKKPFVEDFEYRRPQDVDEKKRELQTWDFLKGYAFLGLMCVKDFEQPKVEYASKKPLKALYCVDMKGKWIPYHSVIQAHMNESDKPIKFSIQQTSTVPWFLEYMHREYFILPGELRQVSRIWRTGRVSGVYVIDIEESKNDILAAGRFGPANQTGNFWVVRGEDGVVGGPLSDEYKNAKHVGDFVQEELEIPPFEINKLGPHPGYFFMIYSGWLTMEDPKQWLDDNVKSFQDANAKHGVTGAIMLHNPGNVKLVIQYFEGTMADCQQLAHNIKYHKMLDGYALLGEGFIGKRFFEDWTMKRAASLKETLTMLKDFVFSQNEEIHDCIDVMLKLGDNTRDDMRRLKVAADSKKPKAGSWEAFDGKVLFRTKNHET